MGNFYNLNIAYLKQDMLQQGINPNEQPQQRPQTSNMGKNVSPSQYSSPSTVEFSHSPFKGGEQYDMYE